MMVTKHAKQVFRCMALLPQGYIDTIHQSINLDQKFCCVASSRIAATLNVTLSLHMISHSHKIHSLFTFLHRLLRRPVDQINWASIYRPTGRLLLAVNHFQYQLKNRLIDDHTSAYIDMKSFAFSFLFMNWRIWSDAQRNQHAECEI